MTPKTKKKQVTRLVIALLFLVACIGFTGYIFSTDGKKMPIIGSIREKEYNSVFEEKLEEAIEARENN